MKIEESRKKDGRKYRKREERERERARMFFVEIIIMV